MGRGIWRFDLTHRMALDIGSVFTTQHRGPEAGRPKVGSTTSGSGGPYGLPPGGRSRAGQRCGGGSSLCGYEYGKPYTAASGRLLQGRVRNKDVSPATLVDEVNASRPNSAAPVAHPCPQSHAALPPARQPNSVCWRSPRCHPSGHASNSLRAPAETGPTAAEK